MFLSLYLKKKALFSTVEQFMVTQNLQVKTLKYGINSEMYVDSLSSST